MTDATIALPDACGGRGRDFVGGDEWGWKSYVGDILYKTAVTTTGVGTTLWRCGGHYGYCI